MEEIKLGDLTPTRDIVYVKDTVRGFHAIAQAQGALGEEINIATQQEISMGELAQHLIQLINPKAVIVQDEQRLRPAKSEVFRLLGSNEKIKQLTGWAPAWTFEKGLAEMIGWFRVGQHQAKYRPGSYVV